MARKSKVQPEPQVEAPATPQLITDTLEKNYMPYVMSVIISRAIPDIDGFKPSHRKLLYTMYKMNLLTGPRSKSANVVGQTMHLNPHGEASIYETLVRLTRGNEALLHPFLDSKGSFGKQYSRDMAYAASRYTEVKLDPFCNELFRGIDKNAVDFVPNYDNTTVEPVLLPTTFPNILISPNLGIAVGMACSICSFNLAEICDGTIAVLKNPNVSIDRLLDIIKAPDFSTGGMLIYDREQMKVIYETGVGSFKLRARYSFNKNDNSIDILQIPYNASIESIMKKITDMIKVGKFKEITDVRDAIDLNGFKLTLDIRKGTDPDKLMAKLFSTTELEDGFDCNFNILVNGSPRQMGIRDIISEWIKFRITCLSREMTFDLNKKKEKLHLLLGLAAILLDIDKAIKIIRNTEHEDDVVPNLMKAFSLTEVQAEYIADIKLRHLNREYILNRVSDIENLEKEIAELEEILRDEIKIKQVIISQLQEIKRKYSKPRKTQLIGLESIDEPDDEEMFFENYNVRTVMTKDGYFKKITMQSIKGSDEQKLKEGDRIIYTEDVDNRGEAVFFTDRAQVYKARICDFEPIKASSLGDYIPAKLQMDDDEHPLLCKVLYDYNPKHHIVFIFENGKGVRVSLDHYETKTKRKKLTAACSEASPLVAAFYEGDSPIDIYIHTASGKAILIKSSLIPEKATRTSSGVTLIQLKAKDKVNFALSDFSGIVQDAEKCRKRKIPTAGVAADQIKFDL